MRFSIPAPVRSIALQPCLEASLLPSDFRLSLTLVAQAELLYGIQAAPDVWKQSSVMIAFGNTCSMLVRIVSDRSWSPP